MPKINVYVSDALAADIKAVGIAVSPVCQTALQQEVAKMRALHALQGDGRLAAASERLANENADADFDAGQAEGREWAITKAERRELVNCQHLADSSDFGRARSSKPLGDADQWPTASEWLYGGDMQLDTEPIDWDVFVDGFVEGAAEAFHAIEAQR